MKNKVGNIGMNIFSRVLLALYAICLCIFSVTSMLIAIKPHILDSIYEYMTYNIMTNTSALILIFIISLGFFIISLVFLFSGIKSKNDRKSISRITNLGEVRISLNSIESIALNVAKRLNGIKETKAYVTKKDENASIAVKIVVMPDINIPAISEEIQTRVKKSVEECCGIPINEVKVIVEGIYSGITPKPRVE